MARVYPKRRQDPKISIEGTRNFAMGLSQIGHPSVIRKNELAEALNVLYTQNGVLEKRPGSLDVGTPRGESTKVNALAGVYNVGGVDYFLRISDDGVLQKCALSSKTWSDVTDSPSFSDTETTILQGWGFVYFLNATDPMRKWDGTTFITFDALADPVAAPSLAKTGTGTGTTTWYYRYVWYNNAGNTLSSPNANIASMPNPLDASTFVEVTLPAAPAGTVKTGIFRGTTSGDEYYLDSVPAAQTVFEDKGFSEPDPLYGIPESNTTGGFHFKFATVYNDAIVGVTTELGDHGLVFSAGGDRFDSFGRADGGGYFFWRRDDGSPLKGVASFQEELYVCKRNKTGAFKFTESGATVRDVNLAMGVVSHKSLHAAGNDLRGWSQDGAISYGNEPNYANVIRTKILSARADTLVQSINHADEDKICGVYYKNRSIWGIPLGATGAGNTSTIVYDERFVTWSEWFGLTPAVWCKFVDSNNTERLFFGDSQSGNVVECWQGTHDRGSPVTFRVATKQFDMNVPFRYKTIGYVYLIFGNVTGLGTTLTLVEDGIRNSLPVPVYLNSGNMGWDNDEWDSIEFDEATGTALNELSGLNVKYIDMGNKDVLSLQAVMQNDGLNDQVQFAGIFMEYSISQQPLPSSARLERA
jgi:hypothetical protein